MSNIKIIGHAVWIPHGLHAELMKIAGRMQGETGSRVSIADVVQDLLDRARAPARKP
jgi:hypothetical protein